MAWFLLVTCKGLIVVAVVWTRMPPVEAHRPVVTYLQFPIQVCFPCNDHAEPATQVCLPCNDHAETTPSQPQLRRPCKAPTSITHRQPCEINSIIGIIDERIERVCDWHSVEWRQDEECETWRCGEVGVDEEKGTKEAEEDEKCQLWDGDSGESFVGGLSPVCEMLSLWVTIWSGGNGSTVHTWLKLLYIRCGQCRDGWTFAGNSASYPAWDGKWVPAKVQWQGWEVKAGMAHSCPPLSNTKTANVYYIAN